MQLLSVRWAFLLSLTLPLLAMPLINCGNNDPPAESSCTTDQDCAEGQICIADECEEDDDSPDPDDECENFFSCETSQNCIDLSRGFTSCDDGCCF